MADDIDKLRKDYEELLGKKPFNGWDAAELQKRIDDKLGASDSEPEEKAEKPAPSASKAVATSADPYPTQADLDAMRSGSYSGREVVAGRASYKTR